MDDAEEGEALMQAAIGATLVVQAPGQHIRALAGMATFTRKGQGPKEERTVRAYDTDRARSYIRMPRGLWPQVHHLTGAEIAEDRRLHFKRADYGWRGQLRPDQARLQDEVLRKGGGVLVCPTGYGKTPLALSIIAAWGQPTLILVNREQIALQWVRQIHRFFNVPPRAVDQIGEGMEYTGAPLAVAMVQSLYKDGRTVERLIRRMGAVVVDEGDGIPAKTLAGVIHRFPAAFRLSLTATPNRTDGMEGLMFALMGPGYTEMSYDEAFRLGTIIRPKVHLIASPLRVEDAMEWAELQRARADDAERNALICRLAAHLHRQGRKVLIPLDLKAHGERIAQMLQQFLRTPAYNVDGEDPIAYRDRVTREMSAGKCVMIATSLADRGLDAPPCDAMILAAPGRSEPRVVQQAGRVVRTSPGKTEAHIYDICDTLTPTLKRQIPSRLKAYREHGFEVVRR